MFVVLFVLRGLVGFVWIGYCFFCVSVVRGAGLFVLDYIEGLLLTCVVVLSIWSLGFDCLPRGAYLCGEVIWLLPCMLLFRILDACLFGGFV